MQDNNQIKLKHVMLYFTASEKIFVNKILSTAHLDANTPTTSKSGAGASCRIVLPAGLLLP